MPRFEPFPGVRYDDAMVSLDDVTAPPYDVITPEEQAALARRSPYNVVHVDMAPEHPGHDRYQAAGRRFRQWLESGVLRPDDEPSFYVYRMGYHDEHGRPHQTSGVIGALELAVPGEGDVLPHEHTMAKPRSDRLNLMRACRANLSPIWGLSLAEGLSALCEPAEPPTARCTDEHGVHHRLWRVSQPGAREALAAAVGSAPVVIADGHHRYETALQYRQELRSDTGSERPGDHDLLLAFVVELNEEQLHVRPIHRMLAGLPDDLDLVGALSDTYEVADAGPPSPELATRMGADDAIAVVHAGRAWLLRPRPEVVVSSDGDADLLERALDRLPPHSVTYQHGVDLALALVEKGEAQATVLLRPPTVDQIAEAARARRRMPAKSTFFHPKPRTGLVFRRLSA